jgi:hypothetical protein
MLHAVLKMFWGPLKNPENEGLPDLTGRERLVLAPLVLLIFYLGLFPGKMLDSMTPSVERFATEYTSKLFAGNQHPDARGMLREDYVPLAANARPNEPTAALARPSDNALAQNNGGAR